jgi:hypothetical protein
MTELVAFWVTAPCSKVVGYQRFGELPRWRQKVITTKNFLNLFLSSFHGEISFHFLLLFPGNLNVHALLGYV